MRPISHGRYEVAGEHRCSYSPHPHQQVAMACSPIRCHNISKMAAPIECCIHVFSDENGHILPISEKTLQKIKDSAEKWRQLDGVEREVGVKAQLSDVQPRPLCTARFHTPCYRLFTYKTKRARSVKCCATVVLPSHDS